MKIYLDGIIYSLQKNGGVTRYTDEIAKKIADLGNKVTFFMHSSQLNQQPKHENINSIYIKTPLKTDNRIIKYITYQLDKFFTELYFKKNSPKEGIFHSSFFSHYKKLKIPQVVTVHDMINEKFPEHFHKIQNKIFLQQKKHAITSADALICVSRQTANDLVELYKINSSKINVIHLGVDGMFVPKEQNDKNYFISAKKMTKPYFLFVGKRSLYKNFQILIESFEKWDRKNDFNLITIGGGKFTEDELMIISKLGLSNNIINFNFVSDEELIMFYNCAQAFIFPSLYEGFGLPIIEAMACGTLVLASDIPVFKEIGGDVPIYFDPKNNNSIIEALNYSLKQNPDNIINGLEIAKKLTWEKTALDTIEVYKKYTNK